MCIYNFLSLYTKQKQNLYTSVYKVREASENREWRARLLGERRLAIFANVCYGAQLNQTLAIPFNLGY